MWSVYSLVLFSALCWLKLDWVKQAHVAAVGADLEEDGEPIHHL